MALLRVFIVCLVPLSRSIKHCYSICGVSLDRNASEHTAPVKLLDSPVLFRNVHSKAECLQVISLPAQSIRAGMIRTMRGAIGLRSALCE